MSHAVLLLGKKVPVFFLSFFLTQEGGFFSKSSAEVIVRCNCFVFLQPLRVIPPGSVHALPYWEQLTGIFRTYIQDEFLLFNAFCKLFLSMLWMPKTLM